MDVKDFQAYEMRQGPPDCEIDPYRKMIGWPEGACGDGDDDSVADLSEDDWEVVETIN